MIEKKDELFGIYEDVEHTLNGCIFLWLANAFCGKPTHPNEIRRIVNEQLDIIKKCNERGRI
jgi:hypothetical protein